ncbi:MAG: SDR family oxidoreductase [Acidobacteriota bacterium]
METTENNNGKIAVTGATGHLGRLIIEKLIDRGVRPDNIVAFARDLDRAADLAELGVELRNADYSKPETLKAALDGVETLMLVSSSEVGQRFAQHKNVIDAAKNVGVSRIVYTSVLKAETAKMMLAAEHKATEEMLKTSGIPNTILRNGWYIENYTESLGPVLEHNAVLGSAGEGKVSAATRADYAAAAAEVLTSTGHDGKTYELGGDAFTLAELASEVGRSAGREIAYKDLPADEYAKVLETSGLPRAYAEVLADSDLGIARGELFTTSDDLKKLIGRPTTKLSAAVRDALEPKANVKGA